MDMEHDKEPLVSVIIPLYNQKRYLRSCVQSLTGQSYRNIEIVIVNDGSTDDSLERARQLADEDNRIVVYDKLNEGVAYTRRYGLLKARGEFVAFIDNDDIMPREAIKTMVNHIVSNNVDMVVGKAKRKLGCIKWGSIFGTFPLFQVISQPELYDKYYGTFFGDGSFPIAVWGKLYRKTVIDKALQETELYSPDIKFLADDLYMNMKLFPYLRNMYMTDDVVYYYRSGGTVDHFNRNYPEVFVLSDKRFDILMQKGLTRYYGTLFTEYVNMVYYHAQQLLEFKKGDRDDVITFFKAELAQRQLVPHLLDYYSHHETNNNGIKLFVNKDYDGMFNYANHQLRKLLCSPKYRIKCFFMRFIERMQ